MQKLIKALLTGCTCVTKTPDVEYHKTGCAYKTAWENYYKGENKMNKQEWVKEAFRYMVSLTGEWEYPENLTDYCESLYEDYVETSDPEDYWTPQDAIDEDMTYWD